MARAVRAGTRVDAALLVEPAAHDASLEHFRRRGLPVVTIGRQGGVRQPPTRVSSG